MTPPSLTAPILPPSLPPPSQGEIIDDCVLRGGVASCMTPAGDWKACDLRVSGESSTAGALGAEDELLVANRTTEGGEACLLPAVAR